MRSAAPRRRDGGEAGAGGEIEHAAAGDQLTVVSWGGAYQDSVRKAFFEPFMKDSGDKIVEEEFNGEIAKQRAMVESGNVTWDVVENDSQTVLAACAEGIIEKIDWDKLLKFLVSAAVIPPAALGLLTGLYVRAKFSVGAKK